MIAILRQVQYLSSILSVNHSISLAKPVVWCINDMHIASHAMGTGYETHEKAYRLSRVTIPTCVSITGRVK